MVGPINQIFGRRFKILKGNNCIFSNRGLPVRKKLDMTLENKVIKKLKLEKKIFFYKKWSPKLVFMNDFSLETILSIFGIKN